MGFKAWMTRAPCGGVQPQIQGTLVRLGPSKVDQCIGRVMSKQSLLHPMQRASLHAAWQYAMP